MLKSMPTFSLRSTAALVCGAFLTALLLPTSVDAAGSALTRITDGRGPVAKVDPSGDLAVGDGSGPLTVDGRVDAPPTPAANPWMNVNGTSISSGNPSAILYEGQASRRLNLTTFSVSSLQAGGGPVLVYAQVLIGEPGDSCSNIGGGSFAAAERFTIAVPSGSTVVETFPSPLTWTQYGQGADTFCVQVSGSGPTGWSASILANGFLT